MKKLLLLIPLFYGANCYSQNCVVVPEALKGTYQGDCKKNKADGNGTASGMDSYTGEFKNGYPDGRGKYTWKNGDWYDGEWKKGQREGKGSMFAAEKDSANRLTTGVWKKDKYIGKYEKPYIVYSKTPDITTTEVTRDNSTNHEITFIIQSTRGGNTGINEGIIPKITIDDINIVNGQFVNRYDDNNMPKTNKTVLRGVQFPFRAKFNLGTDVLDIEFLEEGIYTVNISINK